MNWFREMAGLIRSYRQAGKEERAAMTALNEKMRELARGYLPGDLVRITLRDNDVCNASHNGKGVVTYGPDNEGGWIVSSVPNSLRCVASELTMITPREERHS